MKRRRITDYKAFHDFKTCQLLREKIISITKSIFNNILLLYIITDAHL